MIAGEFKTGPTPCVFQENLLHFFFFKYACEKAVDA